MIERFIIGLSPWNRPGTNPVLMLIFQLGIFSFWGIVAFAPQLLLDRRTSVAGVRKWYKRFLILGYAFIYFITLSATRQAQFTLSASVLMIFNLANFFHFRCIRISGEDGQEPSPLTTTTDREHLRTTFSDTLPSTRVPASPSPRLPTRTSSAFILSATSHILSTGSPCSIFDSILMFPLEVAL